MTKQFSTPTRDNLDFDVDDNKFWAIGVAPASVLTNVGVIAGKDDAGAEVLGMLDEFFQTVLVDDSYALFSERLKSKTKPIPFTTMMEVFEWLVEEYAGRPTELPSGSPAGQ